MKIHYPELFEAEKVSCSTIVLQLMCNIVLIILSVAISPFKHVAFSGDVIVSNMMSQ